MALKYDPNFLLFLRDSPLCKKPENLPPQDEWMGPPVEQQPRTQHQQTRSGHNTAFGNFEKPPRHGDGALLDQTNRRPDVNRHASRNSATNPEELIFGPPRTSFASSGRNKPLDGDKTGRDGELQGRFGNLRGRIGDNDNDRFRDRNTNNLLRRRGETGDQDSEGWSTVKPRKSFGAEGAERFSGRMGGNFRDEKKPLRDRDGKPLDTFSRDRDDDEARSRNNGPARVKGDSWTGKTDGNEARVPEKRERIDRAKNWRERNPETNTHEDRSHDNRRWGRDQHNEREPEWFDEPAEPRIEAHTQQDFQKWMEEMKKSKGAQSNAPQAEPAAEAAKPIVRSPPTVESGPDKFFMAFSSSTVVDAASPGEQAEAPKPKPSGKSSRFTSFFQTQEVGRTDSAASAPAPVPAAHAMSPPQPPAANGLAALLAGAPSAGANANQEEKQAFAHLLAKLQKQSMSATPPGPSPFSPPVVNNGNDGGNRVGPSPFQYSQNDGRHETPLGRPPSQRPHEIHAPRPQPQAARPEQLLQDLVGQHQRMSSQSSGRAEVPQPSRNNSNTEFLMNLMRAGPDSHRADSSLFQAAQQGQKQGPLPHPMEGDGNFVPDSHNVQRQMRPHPPPGFPMEDNFRGGEHDFTQSRPTQILQRPPPPGLDQMPPGWMGQGQMPPLQQQGQQSQQSSQPPQQQRGPMLPPPGLAGGLGRTGPTGPMPHMFPPNMPPMPMSEGMGNMPPRNMGPPPPGFFNGPPPHGFIPPGMHGFNGPPGPESPFVGSPFEARGMPPSGGRGGNFRG